jgi:hypothetical protein
MPNGDARARDSCQEQDKVDEDTVIIANCTGCILLDKSDYAEYMRGTRLAALVALGIATPLMIVVVLVSM